MDLLPQLGNSNWGPGWVTSCTWICPKCDFFNFSDSFFADQLNLENENRFDPLANGSGTKASQTGSDKNKFITGLKFVSIKHQ